MSVTCVYYTHVVGLKCHELYIIQLVYIHMETFYSETCMGCIYCIRLMRLILLMFYKCSCIIIIVHGFLTLTMAAFTRSNHKSYIVLLLAG